MFIKKNEYEIKASNYSVASKWYIDNECKNSISVNIEHDGKNVYITSCEYDGSAYIIADDIGAVKGEIALVRMIFIACNKVMYIIDRGKVAFRDGDKEYIIDSKGERKEIVTEAQKRKVHWYRCMDDLYECTYNYINIQSKMDHMTLCKYLYNFIITFSLKYEDNCSTIRYYGIDDVLTREYGVRFIKSIDVLEVDNSKAEAENELYISDDTAEEEIINDNDEINIDDKDDDIDEDIVFLEDIEETEDRDEDEDEYEDDEYMEFEEDNEENYDDMD